MSDNVRLTNHDKLIAADEIANVKFLKVKMMYGENGSATSVNAENPLPVTLGSENITINGDINIGASVSINNDSDHPVPITGTVTQIDTPSHVDAFGRSRVSQPVTLGDYYHVGAENSEMLLQTSGSGAGNYDISTSSYILQVGTGNGDYAIHQSRMYHHYLPGKSQLVLESFCFGTQRTGTVKRVGYFDDNNGIFFEQASDGSLNIVLRSSITGSPVDTVIPQANWNQNTCNTSIQGMGTMPDGSNPPNYEKYGTWDLDTTKTQLLMIDFQWLGVGRIRFGFVHEGNWIIAHEFYHSNYGTNVYWVQPNLPVRCEIRNTSAVVGTNTFKQICATVLSEGGYIETGLVFNKSSDLTGRTIVNGGNSLPVIAIRLKNSYNSQPVRAVVRAMQASMLVMNGPIYYQLVKFDSHSSITGGTWVSAGTNSVVEYNITATGFSGGDPVSGQFVEAAASKSTTGANAIVNPVTNKRGFIAQNYDSSESQAYAIIATALGTQNNINISAYAALQWSETR